MFARNHKVSTAPEMTLQHNKNCESRADLDSLTHDAGRIALSFESGQERAALIAGTMVADILATDVRHAHRSGPSTLLRLHIGDGPPDRRDREDDAAPCLVIRPSASEQATTIRLGRQPWAACPPLKFHALGWATPADGVPVIESDQGPICSRSGNAWLLHANLPAVYGHEVLLHASADGNIQEIMASQVAMRAVLAEIVNLPKTDARSISLITVDAEDQQRYFINREGVCSNIRGAPSDDMRFSRSCRTIMDRCEEFGLKAIFMVTGDEIDPSFVDAFGDPLIGLDDNLKVLGEIATRDHDVACHGFDHEWWMSKGRSAIAAMTVWEKMRYFMETSGDVRTLVGLARFLVVYAPQLLKARARRKGRRRTLNQAFSYSEIETDIERWLALVGFDDERLFIRYPGYVRSSAIIEFLNDRFAATVDSSDLYTLDYRLPAFPYSILAERDGQLQRTRLIEIPCVWIDKLLRTRAQDKVEAELDRLQVLAGFPGSVLSFVTHTKVLGSAWGHCHVYLHDPLKGMALPIVRESWERFAGFLATRTQSSNWQDLKRALFREAA
jgi:hypothetical protein